MSDYAIKIPHVVLASIENYIIIKVFCRAFCNAFMSDSLYISCAGEITYNKAAHIKVIDDSITVIKEEFLKAT